MSQRTIRLEKHFFIKYQGYGMSNSILQKLKDLNCKTIIIIEEKSDGTKRTLTTTLNKFYNYGEHYKDGEADYQRILCINHFKKEDENHA